jgi:hypothetical protein
MGIAKDRARWWAIEEAYVLQWTVIMDDNGSKIHNSSRISAYFGLDNHECKCIEY